MFENDITAVRKAAPNSSIAFNTRPEDPAEERLAQCLPRLLPFVSTARTALTGGVAVEYHLAMAGRPPMRTRLADIDFVAGRIESIAPDVARNLLVSHYHRAGPGVRRALVQLVDPVARLRIDIFPDLDDAVASARIAAVGGTSLLVLAPESIFAHKLRTLRNATAASPIDPKHLRDARALAELLGKAPPPPVAHVAPAVFQTDLDAICRRCELSRTTAFPLAPKRAIFDLLGYV